MIKFRRYAMMLPASPKWLSFCQRAPAALVGPRFALRSPFLSPLRALPAQPPQGFILPAAADASTLMEPFAAQWPLCARALRAQELHWTPKLNAEQSRALRRALGEAAQIGQWVAHPANRQLPACWPVSQALLELAGEFLSNLDFADRSFSLASAQASIESFTARLLPLAALARKSASAAPLGPSLPSHLGIELLSQTARIAELSEMAGLGPATFAPATAAAAEKDHNPDPMSPAGLKRRADGWRAKAERVLSDSRSFARRSHSFEVVFALLSFILVVFAAGIHPSAQLLSEARWPLPAYEILGARLGGGSILLTLSAVLFGLALTRFGACLDQALWALKSPTARTHRPLQRACWALLAQVGSAECLLLAASLCFAALCWRMGGF